MESCFSPPQTQIYFKCVNNLHFTDVEVMDHHKAAIPICRIHWIYIICVNTFVL